jgi:hypothetical protein
LATADQGAENVQRRSDAGSAGAQDSSSLREDHFIGENAKLSYLLIFRLISALRWHW